MSIRRAALSAGLGLALCGLPGCRGEAPAPPAAQPAPPPAELPAPDRVPGTAAPLVPTSDPRDEAQIDRARGMLRDRFFETQGRVSLPAGAPDHAAALVPADAKLVEVELYRRMRLLEPAPGARRVVLRWLSPLRGAALDAQIGKLVTDWAGGSAPTGARAQHPERGTLSWTVKTPPERPARVEMILDDRDPDGPLPTLAEVLLADAPWLATVAGIERVGFEAGRYHTFRKNTSYTDLERLAAMLRTDDAPGVQRRIEQALVAAGYRVDDDDPRTLWAPGALRTSFTSRIGEGVLSVHFQRRWRRTDPAQAAPVEQPPADAATRSDTPPKRPDPR